MPKLASPESPSLLGVIDHLKLIDAFTMRPSKIVRSSSSRISARCNNPLCLFSIEARGRDYQYEITGISPHSCETSSIVPRQRCTKTSHLSLAAQTFVKSTVNVKCSGKGGASSNTIQSACAAATGVHVSTRQILRLRQLNGSSSTIDPIEALRKLQILPGVLQELQEKLPQLLAILTTTEISHQLHQPAARAFDLAERSFDIHIERSVSCLFFGESDVVQHVENYIGHRIYTADAAHLHRATVGFDCIVLQMTRRAGNGKVFCTASCLTTKGESHEVWEAFFKFCIRLGMQLQHADAFVVSDMQKGLQSACQSLSIAYRECLTHIFHRLQVCPFTITVT